MNSLIYQLQNVIVLCGGWGCVYSGVHNKKILIQGTVTNRIPVKAMLGRVNEASQWNVLTKYCDQQTPVNYVAWLDVSSERNERQGITCLA